MKKISDRYRTDELKGLPADLKDLLDEKYWLNLPHREVANPKVLVVFSGRNGVGKSTLAKRIASELKGLVIENDAIKRILLKERPALSHRERGLITWEYTMQLYSEITSKTANGLIVRDAVIDWYFDRIIPLFTAQGYRVFVVAFDISEAKNRELITNRGDLETVSAELLLNQIKEHEVHIKRFRASYRPNITLADENIFDHDHVIVELRKSIAS